MEHNNLDTYTIVAVLSDLHIKRRTWNNWVKLKGDAQAALDKCAAIIDQRLLVPLCILAGDIFDTNTVSSQDLLLLSQFTSKFQKTLYVRGNHDTVVPSYLSSVSNTQDIALQPYIDVSKKYAFFGLPYVHSRLLLLQQLASLSQRILSLSLSTADMNIYVVMHQAFQHLLGILGMWQITAEDIETILGPDVHVICGHIHKNNLLPLSGKGNIYSPGSLYPLDWGQTQELHFLTLLCPLTGDILRCNIAVRDFVSLDGSTGGVDIISALKGLSEQNTKLLPVAVRLLLSTGQLAPNPADIPLGVVLQVLTRVEHADRQHTLLVLTDTLSILDAVLLDLRDNNPLSYLDLYLLALALYSAPDPALYLDKLLLSWKCMTKTHERKTDAATRKNNAKKRVPTC